MAPDRGVMKYFFSHPKSSMPGCFTVDQSHTRRRATQAKLKSENTICLHLTILYFCLTAVFQFKFKILIKICSRPFQTFCLPKKSLNICKTAVAQDNRQLLAFNWHLFFFLLIIDANKTLLFGNRIQQRV